MTHTTLTRIADGISLPFAALPTLACASFRDHLHLLALADPIPRKVMHLRLNRDGQPDGEVSALPLSYVGGVVVCAGSLMATGKTTEEGADGEHTVIGLNPNGAIQWQSTIPDLLTNGPLVMWPQPLCLNNQPALVWATAGDKPSLWLAMISNGKCDKPQRIASASSSGELAVTVAWDGVAAIQRLQDPARLELVTIAAGQTQQQVVAAEGNPSAPAIAFLDDHIVILWIAANAGEIRIQTLDRGLKPLAPSSIVQRVDRPAKPRNARLIVGGVGYRQRAAIVSTIATPILGPAISHGRYAPTSRAPSLKIAGYVAAYDTARGALGPPQTLTDPPVSYDAAGWAGDRLLVIGGAERAQLSVFG